MTDHDHVPEDGIGQTLRSIEAGGRSLIMAAHQHIGAALNALDDGDFRVAVNELSAAQNSLGALANAQVYIAIADGSQVKKARDLAVGDVLTDVGEIIEFELTECGNERCAGHVRFKIGEHESLYDGDAKFYVQLPSE